MHNTSSKLTLYNSLTKQLELFEPRDEGKVRIYNCGPTVYKRQHIGNMRRVLFADFLRRTLELFGYEVREVMNITDVGHLTQDEIDAGEDKVEKEAKRRKVTPDDIAREQIALFHADLKSLNIQPAHIYPRATKHIAHMLAMIEELITKGHAYVTESGVYFDVQSFADYGNLSGNTLDAIDAGHRVEVKDEKKHPADFALWVIDPDHIQKWDSPWGAGYPGWHIECSAMSIEYLGDDIDIHTGGEDNVFPHHENEIAQSESATGKRFVRVWMHNRHLQFKGTKLAKRKGKQITLDTLRDKGYSPLAFRLLIFSSHYRSNMDFTWKALDDANENLKTITQLLRQLTPTDAGNVDDDIEVFKSALARDLNTPDALVVFLQYVKKANTILSESPTDAQVRTIFSTLKRMDTVIGVVAPLIIEIESETIPDEVKQLAEQREQARQDNNFEKADELRAAIRKLGYKVEDTSSGPRIAAV